MGGNGTAEVLIVGHLPVCDDGAHSRPLELRVDAESAPATAHPAQHVF